MKSRVWYRCKCKVVVLLCSEERVLKLIFNYNLGYSSMLQHQDNCFGKFMITQQTSMVHTTFILYTKAYYKVHTNIHFAHQSTSHGTRKTLILHTKVYLEGRVEFGFGKMRASSNTCHWCVIFHIGHRFGSLRCATRGLRVPHAASVSVTNRIFHT